MAKNRSNEVEWKGRELHVYEDFVQFTALPKGLRQQQYGFEEDQEWRGTSKERLKRKTRVAIATVSRWKAHKEFWDDVRAKMHEWAKDLTPSVIGSLLKAISRDGKASEVKLWMQIFEDFTEKTDSTIKMEDSDDEADEISQEEKDALLALRTARRKRIEKQSDKID